jgi:hypothetical protein
MGKKRKQALTPPKPLVQSADRATSHRNRNLAIGAGAALVAGGAALIGLFASRREGLVDVFGGGASLPEGHAVPDLEGPEHPGPDSRAPEHFRPDPTAPVDPADREALRPPTGPAPSLVNG